MAVDGGSLPGLLTSFVGRGPELDYVSDELGRSRLLTLTGSGGVGKTRLAIEGAARLQGRYAGGVWLVELAALADQALVVQAIAAAFGLREAGARPILEVLVDALPRQPVLLVLDNCEHLLDACASACEALLRTCPQLRRAADQSRTAGYAGRGGVARALAADC